MEPIDCVVAAATPTRLRDVGGIAVADVDQQVVAPDRWASAGQVRDPHPACRRQLRPPRHAGQRCRRGSGAHREGDRRRQPVKLVWTREDDIRGGRYRPLYVHRLRAGLDERGAITGWDHRIVGQSIVWARSSRPSP